ncbi:MAG: hypothetical protein ACKO9H_14995, partial [Planctomycetota bacterium]
MSLQTLLEQIFPTGAQSPFEPSPASWNQQTSQLTTGEIREFLVAVSRNSERLGSRASQIPVQALAEAIARRADFAILFDASFLPDLIAAYQSTPADAQLRGIWLQWLAQSNSPEAWLTWAELT